MILSLKKNWLSVCWLFVFVLLVNPVQIAATVLDTISSKIISSISDSSIRYSLHTSDTRQTMDCLKFAEKYQNNPFGIFHTSNQTTHFSELFYAQKLSSNQWQRTTKLSERGSQGTVQRISLNGKEYGYLIGYQLENSSGNKIAIRYYESQEKIRKNQFLYEYQLNAKVSGTGMRNVGTVSLEEISLVKEHEESKFNQYSLNIKFHYSPDGSHDLPGYGTVRLNPLRDFVDSHGKWIGGCYQNYADWSGYKDTTAEGVMRQIGCHGKIGQRDYFYLDNDKYYLYECNLNSEFDWHNWRIVLYSASLKTAKFLPLVLGGDIDLANPHITLLEKKGNNYQFVLSFFLPGEGIKPGIQAKGGECVVTSRFSYP